MEEIVSYLIKLSDGKFQLLNSMYDITLKQGKALKENNVELLNKAIGEKQDIIERIDILDKEFLEKYELVKRGLGIENIEKLTEPVIGFKSLQSKIRDIMDMLNKIRQVDDSNVKQAKINMDESKKHLQNVRIGKKAYSSYNRKPMEGASIFLDKKE
ncbi:flagellar protein FlgN [Serpentinicella alkaliphila]|uniref:FlgN protein n=1 Tax=Serpentinicella alkaliphila TaxID=1734049 RepID=A0A4R2TKV6_9FIRM|nr:flagellar protein FlgN [Serpentinicella alkaliphila]QUH24908.1 flagellar export chaperone FlgN [Serpentinicella alkaliphila]TCQ01815.1 FlgN protein [Serpentinicella alkaliphila]